VDNSDESEKGRGNMRRRESSNLNSSSSPREGGSHSSPAPLPFMKVVGFIAQRSKGEKGECR
jgi:hypothetical protein